MVQEHVEPQNLFGQPSLAQSLAYPQLAWVGPGHGIVPAASPGPPGYSPAQVRHAYGFDRISFNGTAGDGSGQTIAIIDAFDTPDISGELHTFDTQFGLPDPVFRKVAQDGSAHYPGTDPQRLWELETALDVEWAHAIAPGAAILLVEASSNNWSDLLTAVDYARSQPGVVAVSMSWGGAESSGELSIDSHFTTPSGHLGVTFVASSGDSGTPAEYPAISPNVLGIGGTTLSLNADNTWASESGWSGSGGGVSAYESKPHFQNNLSYARRAGPDVAYNGDPTTGVAVYDDFYNGAGWYAIGGTSAGAPQWSGLIAIADQGRTLAGLSSLDGSNDTLPLLYQMPASAFHDITTGNNGFNAAPGFDLVTGLGSPIADQVVAGLTPNVKVPTANMPNLAGKWFTSGNNATQVQQSGSSLMFINENGQSSSGYFQSSTQVVATGWGNLVGTVVSIDDGIRIAWANGTAWDQPQLAGQGFIGAGVVQVTQNGNNLTFTNENGGVSAGIIADATHIVATGWGNLVGTLTPTFEGYRINWANGTAWDMPRLAGTWSIGSQSTQVVQAGNGTALTLINEFGATASGLIQDASHIVATGWGNLVGTLVSVAGGQIQINWSNGTAWVKAELAQ
jgi:subtilase family serine protease